MEQNLKKVLQETLLDIEAELFASKQIHVLRVYDTINSSGRMRDSLLKLDKILP